MVECDGTVDFASQSIDSIDSLQFHWSAVQGLFDVRVFSLSTAFPRQSRWDFKKKEKAQQELYDKNLYCLGYNYNQPSW